MTLQYISSVASKASPWSSKPVLTDEDEAFLQRVISNSEENDRIEKSNPVGKDAQTALMDGAQNVPLPTSPQDELVSDLAETPRTEISKEKEAPNPAPASASDTKKKSRPWSTWLKRDAKKTKKEQKETIVADPKDIATTPKTVEGDPVSDDEQKQEQEDLATILERLNLAAENNRVVSIGDETQELLQKFKLIFKDIVTGVPTAYHDLELLLTNGDKQLKDAFGHLPGFLRKLVEQLPEKFSEHLGPELMAAASERPSQSGINMENAGKAAAAAQKMRFKIPNVKELVGKPTALVGMLRSITAFLRARFPAVLGVNVLWSLALFIVLLVLWYCHKRGKEVRLANERLVTEAEVAKMNQEYNQHIRPTETLSTTAPRDAPISDVREGVEQVQKAREDSTNSAGETAQSPTPQEPTTIPAAQSAAAKPEASGGSKPDTRRFSLFRSFSKRANHTDNNVQPYPGT
ncbi:hypothetical protein BGW36DRAFT_382734 [Talaromyces proteolyticus]|uniref:Uncharacterized protein n=1 Tax=Talaromyces proteolyticus TaxID=1131652 RepID=A0AAD4KLN9_9EURO|nr:uncharacterized protein BGW36DRAFT_382734 [Talaromyces proteolyticus]KAH8695464.1 hypothetical protein BGW36DRAFT_382734 [Talaromyces proteolyticus]